MAFLVHNLPPIEVFVKKEYLYDHQKGFGELTEGMWISVKSVESITQPSTPVERLSLLTR